MRTDEPSNAVRTGNRGGGVMVPGHDDLSEPFILRSGMTADRPQFTPFDAGSRFSLPGPWTTTSLRKFSEM